MPGLFYSMPRDYSGSKPRKITDQAKLRGLFAQKGAFSLQDMSNCAHNKVG
jgi:hypothetical protein